MIKKELTVLFQKKIWNYYRAHGRTMPWRTTKNPYHIVVSEIMLQQTQVSRVEKYYIKFLEAFPDWQTLARAPLKKVLAVWQGLGYNRRALYLQRAAIIITKEYNGKLPKEIELLIKLPGFGKATAGAVLAYAYNIPTAFIETNIRRVFIYHFFPSKKDILDTQILPLVLKTVDQKNPRVWYWALMDYGSFLATQVPNPNKNSRHYIKQSAFEGSWRQLRANVLKALLNSPLTINQLVTKTAIPQLKLEKVLAELSTEGFIKKQKNLYKIL